MTLADHAKTALLHLSAAADEIGGAPPTYQILPGHTISGRGFNDFSPLQRHFQASSFPGGSGGGRVLATLEFPRRVRSGSRKAQYPP